VAAADLERGRDAYAKRAWREAYEALARANRATPLGSADVEHLATAAYLVARDDDAVAFLEQAHHRQLEDGNGLRAVRCAFWLGMILLLRGDVGPGSGWLGRAQRLLAGEPAETAEHGYLLLPLAFQQEAAGDWEAAAASAGTAADIAVRFDDSDLFALAAHVQGRVLAVNGRMAEGVPLLDEAMVAATSGAESPIVIGVVYCGVILTCVETYEVRRAQEWTDVLSRWCREQPELVAFTGRCLIHRAEIMQLRGAWPAALEEAQRASERLAEGFNRPATAQAFYRQGELHRLRGDFDAAEKAYEAASRYGFEPQPGLALLRLGQGRLDVATASIGRALAEATHASRRAALLPAAIEIALDGDRLDDARVCCRELEQIAEAYGSALLGASVAYAWGALRLREGDAAAALTSLRRAWQGLEALSAPYEAARARTLLALACRALEDAEGASLELDAARDAFRALGARPDLARLEALAKGSDDRPTYGLTARELEVLRLVAAGKSNREIAAELVISEHTVARHLQNLFAKLDVSSRTAASAFAYEHDLV